MIVVGWTLVAHDAAVRPLSSAAGVWIVREAELGTTGLTSAPELASVAVTVAETAVVPAVDAVQLQVSVAVAPPAMVSGAGELEALQVPRPAMSAV